MMIRQIVFKKNTVGDLLRILFLGVALYSVSLKSEPITWGLELTFTNDTVDDIKAQDPNRHGEDGTKPWSQENQDAMEMFYDHMKQMKKKNPKIKKVEHLGHEDKWDNDVVRVTYQDGWSFDVTMDPWSLEVLMAPTTLAELKKNKDRIQTEIYDNMKAVGLEPRRNTGGGHVHMGQESGFGKDVKLFRNWLVDQANHTELATGAMDYDDENAFSLVKLNANQRKKFKELIEKVDSGKIDKVGKLAKKFVADVLFEGKPPTGHRIMKYKYAQINILRMGVPLIEETWDTLVLDENGEFPTWKAYEAAVLYDDVEKSARTAEHRYLRAQMNADHVVRDVSLFEGRMKFLKDLKENLKLSKDFMAGKLASTEQRTKQFYEYLINSGVNPADYEDHLPIKEDGVPKWKVWRAEFQKLLKACDKSFRGIATQ